MAFWCLAVSPHSFLSLSLSLSQCCRRCVLGGGWSGWEKEEKFRVNEQSPSSVDNTIRIWRERERESAYTSREWECSSKLLNQAGWRRGGGWNGTRASKQQRKKREEYREKVADEKFRLVYYVCAGAKPSILNCFLQQHTMFSSFGFDSRLSYIPRQTLRSEEARLNESKLISLLLLLSEGREMRKGNFMSRNIFMWWWEICALFFFHLLPVNALQCVFSRFFGKAKDLEIYKYRISALLLYNARKKSDCCHDLSHPHHRMREILSLSPPRWTARTTNNIVRVENSNFFSAAVSLPYVSLSSSRTFLEFSDSFVASFCHFFSFSSQPTHTRKKESGRRIEYEIMMRRGCVRERSLLLKL